MTTSLQTSSGVRPLPEPPVQALYQPHPSDAYAPSLSSALGLAREALAEHRGANIHDHLAMVKAAVALETRLRLLVDALDADASAVAA